MWRKPRGKNEQEAPLTAIEKALTPAPDARGLASQPDLIGHLVQLIRGMCAAKDVPPDSAATALALAHRAERDIARLTERVNELERLASTDELTGLLNRRGFEAAFQRAVEAADRYDERGVLIFVDLDGFKPVNDTFGHAAGDEVLRTVARVLDENVRSLDVIGRLGGDEFAVLLTRTGWRDGLKRAEALDAVLNAAAVDWQGRRIPINASFGMQTFRAGDRCDTLLHAADAAMYAVKQARGTTLSGMTYHDGCVARA